MPSRPSIRQRNTAACTWSPSRSSDEPAITWPEPRRGIVLAGQPQLEPGAALAAAAVVDGRDARVLRPPAARRPRPAGRSPARRRARPRRAGAARAPASACCSSTSAEMARSASSSSHRGGTSVSDTVPRPSTRRPRGLAAHAGHVGAHAAEVGRRRDRLELERRACPPAPPASRRRSPRSRAPPGSAVGLRPSNRIVMPDRAVPWMSWAASKKESASAGALTARAAAAARRRTRGRCPRRRSRAGGARPGAATDPTRPPSAPDAATARITARVGGSEQQQADDVGDEPRRDQERAAEDHEHPVDHLAVRHSPSAMRVVEAPPDRRGPATQEQRAEHRIGREEQDRQRCSDRVADLEDHVQLRERDDA